MESMLLCSGIHKTFQQDVLPVRSLQEYVLSGWRRERRAFQALSDVSFSVDRGEWVGIFGPNGSGKTTLLTILAGLLPPDAGQVVCSGSVSCFFSLGVGFHPERTAAENIYIHGLLHGIPPTTIRAQLDRIIAFAGLTDYRDIPIKCFSNGMTMRLAFAASATVEADIYLFDEILAVGDSAFQQLCRDHFAAMKRQGKTVVLVHHSLSELNKFCDRIVHLSHGRILSIDSASSNPLTVRSADAELRSVRA